MEKIKALILKLKEMHDVYVLCTNEQKILLIEKAQRFFDELEALGVNRDFSTTLTLYGMEFLLTEYGDPDEQLLGNLKFPLSEEQNAIAERLVKQGALVWREHQGHIDVLLVRGQVPPRTFVTNITNKQVRSQQLSLDVEANRPA